jgi:hypothetical protein
MIARARQKPRFLPTINLKDAKSHSARFLQRIDTNVVTGTAPDKTARRHSANSKENIEKKTRHQSLPNIFSHRKKEWEYVSFRLYKKELPDEILICILDFLSTEQILESAIVCKYWKNIVEGGAVTRLIFERSIEIDDTHQNELNTIFKNYSPRLNALPAIKKSC